MKLMPRRGFAALVVLAALLAQPFAVQAQQINTLTRGTGGVGSLVLGVGTTSAEEIFVAKTSLTNAQVLALNSTPVTVVAAPGSGKVVDVIGVLLSFDYTAAYTSGSDLRLWYGSRTAGSAASSAITVSGFIVSVSADTTVRVAGTPENTVMAANTAVVIQQINGTAFGGGNASNGVTVQVLYRVLFIP